MNAPRRRSAVRRRVAVVTGTRAEYGLLTSTLEAITRHRRLELQLVVTGMHLLARFGRTIGVIRRDGWPIAAQIRMQRGDDSCADQAEGLARGLAGMARFFERASTQIVVVLGDRIEAMAGALAGVTTGRIVAHIHGGDVAPGDFDGVIRGAITKLAHLHLTATPSAARRVLDMGEAQDRVFCVGAPGLDRLLELVRNSPWPRERASEALVVHHPCGRPPDVEWRVMSALLKAVTASGLRRVIVYPNTDRGHSGIVDAIEAHRLQSPVGAVEVHRSLERDAFIERLLRATVLIGNSSSGVIEAGAAGTPAVNVGDRQAGRERDPRMVLDASESFRAIHVALQRAVRLRPRRTVVYGRGGAGYRIAGLLAGVRLDDGFRRKLDRPITFRTLSLGFN